MGCAVRCHSSTCTRRNSAAVSSVGKPLPGIEIDVRDAGSCETASLMIHSILGFEPLTCVVNCAGVGYASSSDSEEILDVNLFGAKRVLEAFVPILDERFGRVVNVGAAGGPAYLETCDDDVRALLTSPGVTWDEIESHARGALAAEVHDDSGYGLSKAALCGVRGDTTEPVV